MKHVVRTIQGLRARFCGDSCADGFREDRRQGLIYGSWQDADGSILSWEAGSYKFKVCAYCRHNLEDETEPEEATS